MGNLLDLLAVPLGCLMRLSYAVLGNYGGAILLFTVLSKVVLLPLSIWLHCYSIRLVKMTPALLEAKAAYFGDNDRIAEEQARLQKEYKYNPLITLLPLAIQIIMLMGVIQVINHPMEYILGLDDRVIAAINSFTINYMGLNPESSYVQLSAINLIQSGVLTEAFAGLTGSFSAQALAEALEIIQLFNIHFLGMNIMLIPSLEGGLTVLAPVVAAFAAFCLCIVQNMANPLQHEQGTVNRITTMLISVGLSAYLGYFVPVGVAMYWVMGNFVAIVQQYFLNAVIPPKKHIDYEALEQGREKLRVLNEMQTREKKDPALAKREKADYKRFFSIANKHLVFYSESNGFYKYYQGIIEYLLANTNLTIHYITSDPQDTIFERAKKNLRIRAYYIGEKKLITLMMKMEADMVVMTMPDLENYHIKRSYISKDIEYLYIPHGMDSLNMTMRTGSMDHYDTVFCVGKHQMEEIRKTEEVYNLPRKNLVEWGYCLLDKMREEYRNTYHPDNAKKTVLIAPSWQKDNIVESCLDELLQNLKGNGYRVVVRPHPQHVRHQPEKMEQLKQMFKDDTNVEIQTDFSSNSTVFEADMMITDWSGIAYEYAFTTCKPVLFVDTPMKIMNPEYQRIDTEPINIWMRERIGRILPMDHIDQANSFVQEMLDSADQYQNTIDGFIHEYVYNLGTSSEVGAKYIIDSLRKKIKERTS